jgi:signal peptidase I
MKMSEKTKDIIEWIVCILVALILALLIRYFIGTPTVVKQSSMKPTLIENQRLILNRGTRTTNKMPERGDIITLEAPSEKYVYDYDENNVIARYENEPTNWFDKFVYYFLEIGKESYIKRVIALPGEHLEIKDGKVYINGEELDEPYLQEGVVTTVDSNQPYYDLVVPENCVFVMGDNRTASTDSRAFGCIPLEKLEGTVWIRFWPLNLFGKVE